MRGATVRLHNERLLAPDEIALIALDVHIDLRPLDPMLVA